MQFANAVNFAVMWLVLLDEECEPGCDASWWGRALRGV